MIIGAAWLKEKNGQKYFYVRCDLPLLGKLNFIIKKRATEKKGNQPDYDVIWWPEKEDFKETVVQEDEMNEDIPF